MWNYQVPYTTAFEKLHSVQAIYLEYTRMLMWLDKSPLTRGKDYEWSIPVNVFVDGHIMMDMMDIPQFLYFDQEKDVLAFKLVFRL